MMHHKFSALAAGAVLLVSVQTGFSQAAPAPAPSSAASGQAGDAKSELKELMGKINEKIQKDQKTESALAPEIKQFDALLAEHKGEKTDDVAHILLMKAVLYSQVFENYDKAAELVKQMAKEFPDTRPGKQADQILDSIKRQADAQVIQKALVEGNKFPEFNVTDVAGKPLSLGNYKGKVVLIDFWATWCGPCRGEIPNVVETYHKYHDKGFDVIGVSLDQDKTQLSNFTKENGMIWRQFFDGGGWTNQLAVKYGIMSIPATFLLDGNGKIIAKGARGEELGMAVAKALAAK